MKWNEVWSRWQHWADNTQVPSSSTSSSWAASELEELSLSTSCSARSEPSGRAPAPITSPSVRNPRLATMPSVQSYSTPCLQCNNTKHPAFSAKILNSLSWVQSYLTLRLQCNTTQHYALSAVIFSTMPSVHQYSTFYSLGSQSQVILLSSIKKWRTPQLHSLVYSAVQFNVLSLFFIQACFGSAWKRKKEYKRNFHLIHKQISKRAGEQNYIATRWKEVTQEFAIFTDRSGPQVPCM